MPDVVEQLEPSVVTVRVGDGLGSGGGVPARRRDHRSARRHRQPSTSRSTTPTAPPPRHRAGHRHDRRHRRRPHRPDRPAVPEYRTDLPRAGESVLAIGSPLGLENTVTAGIVSGVDRQIPGSAAQGRALVDLIQVDAPISPGNSGGALLDGTGRVIGINEAYLPPSTGAVSLGFAIPAATATNVADQLLADGTATHPYLGVSLGQAHPADP